MKTCIGCKYAEWKKTKAGKLHPSGDGHCGFPWEMPKLPAAMYWIGSICPHPSGGHINQGTMLTDSCVYFQRDKDSEAK